MKIGIEIHQRLNVGKLFCSCPSDMPITEHPTMEFERQLNISKSETGEIDNAAKFEVMKRKKYEYISSSKNACLVDADEEPPHNVNPDALRLGLKVVKSLNAKPVDELYYMRKIVVDGSNTSGFQRTAIIGIDGWIDTSMGKVHITTIALEEESAGIVKDKTGKRIYDLGRLGIPLVEITTEPDIKNENHLKETAEKIGLTLRGLEGVARGLGTIRQDINISADNNIRVEIKGVQDLKIFPTIALEEIKRRQALGKLYGKIKDKTNVEYMSKMYNLTTVFKDTKSDIIKSNISKGNSVFGVKLKEFSGIFGTEIQIGRRYGTEISDYVKHCGVRGIIHSDENLEKYKFSNEEIDAIRHRLNMNVNHNDLFVLVIAKEDTATCVFTRMKKRIGILEITKETRKANKDGSTSYLRPMPGSARMYPETDIPPIKIDMKYFNSIKLDTLDTRKQKLEKLVGKQMTEVLIRSKNLPIFMKLVEKGYGPKITSTILENTIISLRRDGVDTSRINYEIISEILSAYDSKRITKSAIEQVLRDVGKGIDVSKSLQMYAPIKEKELEKIVIDNKYDMKKIMSKHRLRVFPNEVIRMINKLRGKSASK